MKLPKKDLITLLIALLSFSVLAMFFINNFSTPKPKPQTQTISHINIPILLYHYVEYNQDERDFIRDSLNIEPHVFEKQITTLKDAGYTFITPKELPTLFKLKDSDINTKYVILSFDDGYGDFYTDVFPLLKKHNVKAVNYVVYNFINRPNYMTKDQLQEIVNSGLVEIGSHTLNHIWLSGLSDEVMKNEISLSKIFLEKDYGISVVSFAYPYGEHDAKSESLVESLGYTNAVTDDLGTLVKKDMLFTIPRVRPGYNTGQDLLDRITSVVN